MDGLTPPKAAYAFSCIA